MPRIPYAERSELPPEKRDLLDTLSDGEDRDGDGEDGDETERREDDAPEHSLEGGTLNVYRTLGRNVDLLEGFRTYASTVWAESGLDPGEREVAILSTTRHAESPYEWHQHVRIALDEGLTPEEIVAISNGDLERLDPDHAAIAAYVERFVEGSVDDATHDLLADRYDDDVVLGICALSGLYLGLARLLSALEVETEAEFVGWNLENL